MSDVLLPPNASGLARAIDAALATRLDNLPVPIKDTLNADVIPVATLPWLAYSFGRRNWNAAWPEAVRRAVVRNAIPTARRLGTVRSVHDIVADFGGALAIREWWELTPKGPPFTFSIVLTLNGQTGETASAAFVDEVIAEIEQAKPVRAHFTFTQGLAFAGQIEAAGALRPVIIRRMEFEQAA